MAQIPKIIPLETAPAIATYNYTDIAEGTGVVIFQGFQTRDDVKGYDYHLTTSSIYSNEIQSVPTTYDFNLSPFNSPKTIKGTAIIRFSTYWTIGGATGYLTFKLQKVALDASVSDLGSSVSVTRTGTGTANNAIYMDLVTTHFKIGESLRLNVVKTGSLTALGHDPANRDGSTITPAAAYPTKLEVYVPFRLEF